MTVPEIVRERLGGADVRARVPLGGDDELLVTADRTLIYRAEGLLSGESVEEYSHDAERIAITEGRRKSTIRLDHGLDGDSEFTIPSKRIGDALESVLEGVLAAAGVTEPGESIEEVYRLGELTLVITDARAIKHVGADLWDVEEYEAYEYADVTDLDIEQGNVSSQVIVEVDGRPQRIKAPADDARQIRGQLQRALLAYHDVESYDEFRELVADEDEGDEGGREEADTSESAAAEAEARAPDGDGEAVLESESGSRSESESGSRSGNDADLVDIEEAAAEASGQPVDVAREVAALRTAVERQNELLGRHHEMIEQLIEELRRGR